MPDEAAKREGERPDLNQPVANQPVANRPGADEPGDKPRQWDSTELLEGHSEAIIVHAGEVYRLRCTRNNKLILHK